MEKFKPKDTLKNSGGCSERHWVETCGFNENTDYQPGRNLPGVRTNIKHEPQKLFFREAAM